MLARRRREGARVCDRESFRIWRERIEHNGALELFSSDSKAISHTISSSFTRKCLRRFAGNQNKEKVSRSRGRNIIKFNNKRNLRSRCQQNSDEKKHSEQQQIVKNFFPALAAQSHSVTKLQSVIKWATRPGDYAKHQTATRKGQQEEKLIIDLLLPSLSFRLRFIHVERLSKFILFIFLSPLFRDIYEVDLLLFE